MMIRLPNGYNGRLVNNQSVPPGDYDEDDPRLHGIADYLVTNGFATRIAESEAVKPAEPTPAPVVAVPEFLEGRVVADPVTGAWRATVRSEDTPDDELPEPEDEDDPPDVVTKQFDMHNPPRKPKRK